MTPAAGLYTAVVAGLLISALGGTRVCVGGPTGAFIAILYGIQQHYGPANAAICTMLAGVMLLALGWAKLGTLIKFIPFPVTLGFTSGIAVVIFSTQVKDFLGLQLPPGTGEVPAEFVKKIVFLAQHLDRIHSATCALAAGAFVVIRWWPAQLARVVMSFPEVDATRVGAMGGSQGGALTLAWMPFTLRMLGISVPGLGLG